MKKKLAILLTVFNRREVTLQGLKSVFDSIVDEPSVDIDIFLLDDGSTDGTAEAVKKAFPTVKVSKSEGDLYWGRGMIRVWEEAAKYDYDFYLWLNDDSYIVPNAIEKLLADSAKFDYKAIIAGACCKPNNKEVTSYAGSLLKERRIMSPVGSPLLCDYFNGNFVLIPREVFLKVGYLDPIFIHCGGDLDYGLRAKKLGINSYISSEVLAVCDTNDDFFKFKWCNPKYSFKERLKNFRSPVCYTPKQIFIFEKRHYSLISALYRSGMPYVRFVFPQLWVMMDKIKNRGKFAAS